MFVLQRAPGMPEVIETLEGETLTRADPPKDEYTIFEVKPGAEVNLEEDVWCYGHDPAKMKVIQNLLNTANDTMRAKWREGVMNEAAEERS